jgi:renal tumor antigen
MERNMYEHIKERKAPLEEKRVKKYLYQLIKGLDFIHKQGIFHRDIKPENILLKDDRIKLIDFGSCKGMKG